MGRNLAKSPLIAVFYAALICFFADFYPFSIGYAMMRSSYLATTQNHLLLFVYCLWISVAAALFFSAAQTGGPLLFLKMLICFWVLLFDAPMLEKMLLGEVRSVADVITTIETATYLMIVSLATLWVLVLIMLLYRLDPLPANKRPGKIKIRRKNLLITLAVLPFIFLVIYILCWYFLGWRDDFVRAYWGGAMQNRGFADALVNLLLDNAMLIPVALLRGLVYAGASLLLALVMATKRTLYIVCNVMLYASAAVGAMIPNVAVPADVRWMLVAQSAAMTVPYGVVTAILLHRTLEIPAPAAQTAPAAAGRPGADGRPGVRPSGVRR